MTIASSVAKSGPYTGNGTQTVFAYAFKVFDASDLQVVLRSAGGIEAVQTLTTHYTVSGVGQDGGGNVTMLTAPPVGATLTIARDVDFVQLTDLRNQGGFYPEVHERAFDRLTQQTQQLKEGVDSSLRLPVSTPSGVSTLLPSPEQEKLIGWNIAGTGLQNYDKGVFATLVAYGTARADLFSGDGTTSQFTLTSNPGNQSVLDVSISGVTQRPGVDYTWAGGTTLVFAAPPPLGTDNILARYFQGLPGIITEAQDVTFTPGGVGASPRSAQEKMRDIISAKDFGAVGNGVADDRASIAAAFAAATEVYFPPGTYLVGSNLTIATNKVVRMAAGAAFSVAAGVTLTINAHFEGDPDSYHFQGAGSVVGVVDVYPEWFGAVGNGTTDDLLAFQRASTCVKSDGSVAVKCTIQLQAKQYLLSSTWTVEPTANRPIDVIGMGTLIGGSRLLSSITTTAPLMVIQGNTDNTQSIVDFTLSGFAIISQNVGQGIGLYFNYTGNARLNGLQKSLVEDIYVGNFKQGIVVRNTRLVKFSRLSVWNNGIDGTTIANANWCMIIQDGSVGQFDFCGDLTFESCQFVARKDYFSKLVQVNAQSANSATAPSGKSRISLAGIRFTECVFYRGGNFSVGLTATNYSQMGDIWFTNCQFDDTTGMRVDVGSANAFVTNIQIKGNYYTAVAGNCVRLEGATNPNAINSIQITDNYCAGVFSAAAVVASYVDTINVTNNQWSGVDWSIGSVMLFDNCNNVICNDNNAARAGLVLFGNFANLVSLSGTGNRYVVIGNNGAGQNTGTLISNTTGAANIAIANNI